MTKTHTPTRMQAAEARAVRSADIYGVIIGIGNDGYYWVAYAGKEHPTTCKTYEQAALRAHVIFGLSLLGSKQ